MFYKLCPVCNAKIEIINIFDYSKEEIKIINNHIVFCGKGKDILKDLRG